MTDRMENRIVAGGLSQEWLKVIACVTMFIDHFGAIFVSGYTLRIIGRIAFPIYCFLLAEGAHYTKNPRKYCLRLFIGLLLSEIPYDLALKHGLTWRGQSVMVTLFLGFLAIETMEKMKKPVQKLLILVPFVYAAEYLHADYGGNGVILILMFALTRELSHRLLWQTVYMVLICGFLMPGLRIPFMGIRIGIELFAVFSMIPIALYSGKKTTGSRMIQWMFYLFYPVHLLLLYVIKQMI